MIRVLLAVAAVEYFVTLAFRRRAGVEQLLGRGAMDERPTKRRGPLTWLAGRSWRWWVAAAMVGYPLSVGPAMRLSQWLGTQSFLVIYVPLGWVASKCESVGYGLALYVHYFWGIDFG